MTEEVLRASPVPSVDDEVASGEGSATKRGARVADEKDTPAPLANAFPR
jgi:hypothetical protein